MDNKMIGNGSFSCDFCQLNSLSRTPAFRGVRAANPTLKRTECECSSPTQGQNKGRGRRRRSEKGGPVERVRAVAQCW